GSVRKQPVVRDGQIAIADIMQATVSADHRVVNGAEAAQFLNEIKGFLQKPASLLV
ncbi:MAG: 2-oxo acid dehydrogenase subunit E2, partial [Chloroflexi bacterium]|nr:2-oxo acid dehydrogenase subunit E2 [Chloroflexota bacterium]